jgi:uridine kinase
MRVTITLPSGRELALPAGTVVERIFEDQEFCSPPSPIVAALVNKALTSLSYPLEVNCRIEPVPLASREGANVYRRSLCFLLAIAAKQAFPERRLIIGHSLGRGYLYFFDGLNGVPEGELDRLRRAMHELVSQSLAIRREVVSYTEAVHYFEHGNQPDTVLLLKNRNDPKIPVYTCGEFMDLAHAPLLPNTGLLATFQILGHAPGFLLRYPPWNRPQALDVFEENPVLSSIYREYKDWGKILGVSCVGHLNDLIAERRVREFIQVAEALQDKKIAQIADRLNERRDVVRLILVAGPSSSGKTTFSKKLAIQLRVLGRNPVLVSQDDYFLSKELTPRDEEGNYDFESLEAIDIELLNEQLIRLFSGGDVSMPHFDFHSSQRKADGVPLKLPSRAVLILEGIHCLNDALTPAIPAGQKYKIYVSALTQLNLDDHNRISTTDNRLLRRLVRDHQFRGHSALNTLARWQSVRNGEVRNIFPFQNKIDSAFNSALDYELAVLKVYAEPLLKTVKPDQEQFHEALRLLSFIENFAPIPPGWVPDYSILREFIGESAFKY